MELLSIDEKLETLKGTLKDLGFEWKENQLEKPYGKERISVYWMRADMGEKDVLTEEEDLFDEDSNYSVNGYELTQSATNFKVSIEKPEKGQLSFEFHFDSEDLSLSRVSLSKGEGKMGGVVLSHYPELREYYGQFLKKRGIDVPLAKIILTLNEHPYLCTELSRPSEFRIWLQDSKDFLE